MVFSSMTFLFAFLPVVVLVYMLSPKQMKNAILLIASLFFYAWGEPKNILLMLLSIGINYVFGRIIEADRASQSKMRVWNLGFAVAKESQSQFLHNHSPSGFAVNISLFLNSSHPADTSLCLQSSCEAVCQHHLCCR